MASQLSGVMAPTSTTEKPPLRGMTAEKKPASSLPGTPIGPRVAGLPYSRAISTTVPATSSDPEVRIVIRVVTDHVEGRRERTSSKITGKPRPPATTARATGSSIQGSPAKPIMPSGHSTKPPLLNADTAWKIPSHSAAPGAVP